MIKLNPILQEFENQTDFLEFLRSRFKVFHLSNVFFRDLHYGVMQYLASKKKSVGYTVAEAVTQDVIVLMERKAILKKLDERTWLVDYPAFKAVRQS
ncbi:MAG: hypothetical protein HY966_05805 [Ignavibacteriales bacterium]|nr:hypothetical protein [Ignavibacteriales bacterium]